VEALALLATTLELIRQLRPHTPRAAVTLVPHAAWVAFAAVLTAEIARGDS
jgi:tryptophan-rich sensory protein